MRRIYILIIIALVAILLTGFAVTQNYFRQNIEVSDGSTTNNSMTVKNKPTIAPQRTENNFTSPFEESERIEINPAPVDYSIDVSKWKTYTNSRFGFSFKYPDKFVLEDFATKKNKDFPNSGALSLINKSNKINEQEYISMHIAINPAGYGQIVPNTIYIAVDSEEDGIMVNKEIHITYVDPERNEDRKLIFVNDELDEIYGGKYKGNQYDISFLTLKSMPEHEATFRRILSTFRFNN